MQHSRIIFPGLASSKYNDEELEICITTIKNAVLHLQSSVRLAGLRPYSIYVHTCPYHPPLVGPFCLILGCQPALSVRNHPRQLWHPHPLCSAVFVCALNWSFKTLCKKEHTRFCVSVSFETVSSDLRQFLLGLACKCKELKQHTKKSCFGGLVQLRTTTYGKRLLQKRT